LGLGLKKQVQRGYARGYYTQASIHGIWTSSSGILEDVMGRSGGSGGVQKSWRRWERAGTKGALDYLFTNM
jgi:hypothetical protein